MERLPTEITENGIHYTLHGDYYFPDLVGPDDHRPIGKWGWMHQAYLREHKPGLYSRLFLSGISRMIIRRAFLFSSGRRMPICCLPTG